MITNDIDDFYGEDIPSPYSLHKKSLLTRFEEYLKSDSDLINLDRIIKAVREELDKIKDRDLGLCQYVYEKDGQIVVEALDLSFDLNCQSLLCKLHELGQKRLKIVKINAGLFNKLRGVQPAQTEMEPGDFNFSEHSGPCVNGEPIMGVVPGYECFRCQEKNKNK